MNSSSPYPDHTIVPHRYAAFLLITLVLAFAGIFSAPARGAVTEAWVHRYSNVVSNRTAEAVRTVFDSAGDVIVIGNIPESGFIAIIKYSGTDGSVAWQKRYHSAGSFTSNEAKDVGVDGDNNLYVLGRSYPHYSNEQPTGYFILKLGASDGALLWEKPPTGTGQNDEFGYALAVDGAGNVIVTAPIPEGEGLVRPCTAKYAAADGALLWEQCHSEFSGMPFSTGKIAVDGSGNVVVTGSPYSPQGFAQDNYIIKYAAADGALLWEKRTNAVVEALAVDGDGNVVVTGYYTTIKYMANGTSVWTNTVLEGIALAVDGSGNVVVTGRHYDGVSQDYRTVKFDAADGTLLWEQIYIGPNGAGEVRAVAVDSSGNAVVTGESVSDDGSSAYHTAKYAAVDGVLLWEQLYDRSEGSYGMAVAVAVDASGNVVVTGNSASDDICTVKHAAADGALLWDNCYDGSAVSEIYVRALTVDANGNVIVTGSSYNAVSGDLGYYTAKYAAADGAPLWDQRYNDSGDDAATAVVVDASGNVVVTGSTATSGGHDFYTAKYASADGLLLWEKRYNGPGNRFDLAKAVAVDGSGNVVVAGDSNNGTNADIHIVKYAAADGALLWERRYSGPATDREHDDRAIAVALDGHGDVVIAGYSETAAGEEYYTAKHAGADGTLLWERRHNSPVAYDEVESLVVDVSGNVVVTGTSGTIKYLADGTGSWTNTGLARKSLSVDAYGNVVVAGSSYNTNGNYDFYTAKYASADGALLWERRYNGPADGDDFASTVAVDASGNVVVAGESSNGTNADYYTAKYAATDGALLWEKRYNGPANGEDNTAPSHSLALGPNGMIAITGRSANLDGNFDIATVVYRENLPAVSIALVPAGVRLRFTGTPGLSYQIERAPTVMGPWTTIATPTESAGVLIEYMDTNAPAGSVFYRTVLP